MTEKLDIGTCSDLTCRRPPYVSVRRYQGLCWWCANPDGWPKVVYPYGHDVNGD